MPLSESPTLASQELRNRFTWTVTLLAASLSAEAQKVMASPRCLNNPVDILDVCADEHNYLSVYGLEELEWGFQKRRRVLLKLRDQKQWGRLMIHVHNAEDWVNQFMENVKVLPPPHLKKRMDQIIGELREFSLEAHDRMDD